MILKKEIEEKLSHLYKKRFNYMGRAASLLWLGFGDMVERVDRKNNKSMVAYYSLHVQCPWRLSSKNEIIVGSQDYYYPNQKWLKDKGFSDIDAKWEDVFEWDKIGSNIFDEKAQIISEQAENNPIFVEKIEADNLGGVKLSLSNGFVFEIFPNDSLKEESWRFFTQNPDEPHYVVFEEE